MFGIAIWGMSYLVTFALGDKFGVFCYDKQVQTGARIENTQMRDGTKAIILRVEHPFDRRYHEDFKYIFIESEEGTYLPIRRIMAKNVNDAKSGRNDLDSVVEELIDSNEDGCYDLQRVFYEDGIHRRLVKEQEIGEISKKDLSIVKYKSDERRFR